MWCRNSPDLLSNATLSALVCSSSQDVASACVAICPNADLAGVGVRTAFYLQSVMNTLLVVLSRQDSVPSAWASTLLTASLVIAAMVQKCSQSISLHHATLTMNFATLSCISSLAVAPMLSIWHLSPENYYTRQLARHVINAMREERSSPSSIWREDKKSIREAQSREHLFLALALLTQVVLQWAWGIVLFVSPVYSQPNCSGDTNLILFLAPITAREINHGYMVIWVFWLICSLGITLGMTVVLALTSPTRARIATTVNTAQASPIATRPPPIAVSTHRRTFRSTVAHLPVLRSTRKAVPAWMNEEGQVVFWYNTAAVVLWLVYFICAKVQIQVNCIFDGENVISSFGQITALLLAMQPLWSVIAALHRWPKRRRKNRRHLHRV